MTKHKLFNCAIVIKYISIGPATLTNYYKLIKCNHY